MVLLNILMHLLYVSWGNWDRCVFNPPVIYTPLLRNYIDEAQSPIINLSSFIIFVLINFVGFKIS